MHGGAGKNYMEVKEAITLFPTHPGF